MLGIYFVTLMGIVVNTDPIFFVSNCALLGVYEEYAAYIYMRNLSM
jgi:hypothetical protein